VHEVADQLATISNDVLQWDPCGTQELTLHGEDNTQFIATCLEQSDKKATKVPPVIP